MQSLTDEEVIRLTRKAFADASVGLEDCEVRRFPNELIVIATVGESDFANAVSIASAIDSYIPGGFITVRKGSPKANIKALTRVASLVDPRVSDLIEVLNARSRTSEQQPSLRYVRDAEETLSVAVSKRHHIIFGRRGVGKTALMLEAKKQVESKGAVAFWMNIQTMRNLSASDAFLTMASRLCDLPLVVHGGRATVPISVGRATELRQRILQLAGAGSGREQDVAKLVPDVQALFNLFGQEIQTSIYLFLDDFHYLPIKQQPGFLDLVHAITRDNPLWIKAAGIKHQARWFTDNPPMGLQTGHDAAIIDLDITLQQPAKAKQFLVSVLRAYTDEARLSAEVISPPALDRLVLASGAVPRDFLILSATAIQVARQRSNARAAGVQDVNEAAGRIAQTKLQELEDDAASSVGKAAPRMEALTVIRNFLIEQQQTTYFRIDFQDKELRAREYELLQSLMDLRMIHLINAGVSDERQAGRRSEVYMLDLSQFSGTRFKRNLRVLDFDKKFLVLKETGAKSEPKEGSSPNKLLGILRRGPLFSLSNLSRLVPSNA